MIYVSLNTCHSIDALVTLLTKEILMKIKIEILLYFLSLKIKKEIEKSQFVQI